MSPIGKKPLILTLLIMTLQGCGGGGPGFDSFDLFWAVVVTDLNQDSVADVVLTHTRARDRDDRQYTEIYLNSPTSPGQLTASVKRLPGGDQSSPSWAAVGDLNQDGLPDIASFGGNSIVVLYQDDTQPGRFLEAETIATLSNPAVIAIGDLDQDGVNDLAVAGGSPGLRLLLQDSLDPGSFLPPVSLSVADASSVAIGDLDGDLINDLAISVGESGQVKVLVQDAGMPGNFDVSQSFSTGPWATDVKLDDLDQDGAVDLIVANSGYSGTNNGSVSILLQDLLNPGQFFAAVNYGLDCRGGDINLGDLNADGMTDISVASLCGNIGSDPGDGRLSLLFQDPADPGRFLGPSRYQTDGYAWAVAIGDVDDDGLNDLIISEQDLVVRYQDPSRPGQFQDKIVIREGD